MLALVLGAIGGALFHWLRLPLAWMIGAMVFVTIAAAAGAPVGMSLRLRSVMIAVLGVMLGSAFTPDIVDHMARWWSSIVALFVYVALTTGLCMYYYQRVGGYDRVTAYFSAAPGGLSEMVMMGGAMGGDERAVALSHGARILLIVLVIPFGFQLLGGYQPGGSFGAPAASVPLADLAVLLACGVVGYGVARLLRMPSAALIGPMALSAAVHLLGLTTSRPPAEAIAVAQVVVGTGIGCRFAGVAPGRILKALSLALGATAILLVVSAGFAAILAGIVEVPLQGVLLAFSPGGLAEMSLIALALGIDVAYVSSQHVVRIFIIIALAPWVFRLLQRKKPPAPPATR
jgi:membrane AbrB-like protein